MKLSEDQLTVLRDALKHQCVGYPICDGDLPGEDHDPKCPAYGYPALEPKLFRASNFLDTIDALRSEHAASLAAFAQRAAAQVIRVMNNTDGVRLKERIESLIPTANLEYQLALTVAKIEEARYWGDRFDVAPYTRRSELEAEATRIKAAIEAARRKS